MKFHASDLNGVWLLEPERHNDERGFFARTFCRKEFEAQGLNFEVVQCNIYDRLNEILEVAVLSYEISFTAKRQYDSCFSSVCSLSEN